MPKVLLKNGISIYYEVYGDGDPIVFIAGFTADHSVWDAIPKICAARHRVIIFDNRGVGQSDCPGFPYTAELLADDTKELCDALGIKQASFVGSSMGGKIVMVLAHKYPDLVKAAIISNSVMKIGNFLTGYLWLLSAQLMLIKLAKERKELADTVREIFMRINLGWIFSGDFLSREGVAERLIKAYVENPCSITAIGFTSQINVFMTFDASAWLKDIKCPCLVISSDGDRALPALEVEKVAKAIPGAQFYLFTGGIGHLPYVEQPEKFCEVLLNFVAEACSSVFEDVSSVGSSQSARFKFATESHYPDFENFLNGSKKDATL